MNLFSRALQNLPLTPAERAFLKLLKGWLYTALISGLTTGAQYLATGQIDWIRLAYIAGGAFVLSVLNALDKFFTAQGDSPAALIVQSAEKQVQQQVNQKISEPQPITFPTIAPNTPSQAPALMKNQFQTVSSPYAGATTSVAASQPQSFSTEIHFGDTGVVPATQTNRS